MRIDKVDTTETVYHSIRETARITGLAEYNLRNRLKNGRLPGLYSGRKFLVNVPSLLKLVALEEEQRNGYKQ
ncbi:hypothetical protein [Blautia obeum]|uniref:hypothetical protein n=1 Tax=Blautia obeum TaxID=40520 RepID=UPI003564F034